MSEMNDDDRRDLRAILTKKPEYRQARGFLIGEPADVPNLDNDTVRQVHALFVGDGWRDFDLHAIADDCRRINGDIDRIPPSILWRIVYGHERVAR